MRAGDLLGLKLGEDEIEAWKKLRHKPAHGSFDFDFSDNPKVQMAYSQTAKVANIVNKFVLALIKYEGPFRDFGSPCFPTREFP